MRERDREGRREGGRAIESERASEREIERLRERYRDRDRQIDRQSDQERETERHQPLVFHALGSKWLPATPIAPSNFDSSVRTPKPPIRVPVVHSASGEALQAL